MIWKSVVLKRLVYRCAFTCLARASDDLDEFAWLLHAFSKLLNQLTFKHGSPLVDLDQLSIVTFTQYALLITQYSELFAIQQEGRPKDDTSSAGIFESMALAHIGKKAPLRLD